MHFAHYLDETNNIKTIELMQYSFVIPADALRNFVK